MTKIKRLLCLFLLLLVVLGIEYIDAQQNQLEYGSSSTFPPPFGNLIGSIQFENWRGPALQFSYAQTSSEEELLVAIFNLSCLI
ncbi:MULTISPECIES: hypothetical protein [unclassified Anabaena]|uniref:hypothetical protein n=1 Tax=unclassified Anabaena TaxID=2619674 RepID=UPI002B1F4E9E|nr:hypothetical protein [Anabaena sp. UHCC 0399]MEA5566565.1 hypothetical protein [Anabaena sp. UHCC 0399]